MRSIAAVLGGFLIFSVSAVLLFNISAAAGSCRRSVRDLPIMAASSLLLAT